VSEIYWVIAGGTDSGKSVISDGLLRALTEMGKSSLGFKPFSTQNILTSLDSLDELPNGRLIGLDTVNLLAASSAINKDQVSDLLEIANPNKSVFFDTIQSTFMLRTGAPDHGYGMFCHVKNEANVLGRPDVREFLKRKELLARVIQNPPVDYSYRQMHTLFTENINTSLERLRQFKPDAFVFEGASRFMPMWQGSPLPDHIVVVNGGVAEIISGIDHSIQRFQNADRAPTTQDLYKLGPTIAQKSFQIEVPLALAAEREAEITSTMKTLLSHAGI